MIGYLQKSKKISIATKLKNSAPLSTILFGRGKNTKPLNVKDQKSISKSRGG
jgi:hypothetical protein